jgi:hypothetical protein
MVAYMPFYSLGQGMHPHHYRTCMKLSILLKNCSICGSPVILIDIKYLPTKISEC